MIAIDNLKIKKVSILGTGLDGVKCAHYLYNQKIFVKCFLNNNSKVKTFMGLPVYEPGNINISDEDYIVIAVGTISTYLELSAQLYEMGLNEFKDYVYYKWIDKKIVLLHGNCHMVSIKSYLESSKEFSARYAIYPNPCICDNKDGYIKNQIFENCDVWIHEDIRKDNEYGYYLSDEFMRNYFINRGIYPKEIIIPHLFGLGKAFFPQSGEGNKRNEEINNGSDRNGMFPHSDMVIDECVKQGKTVEEIIDYCKSNKALNDDFILENFNKYMKKIQKREESWDIKIYNFIINNYQKEKLFYDEGHPTNIIMKKISGDILYELKIQEDVYTDIQMDDHENPIYPAVKHALNLEWEEGEIRKSSAAKKMCDQMDFEEYIKEYLVWIYKISV